MAFTVLRREENQDLNGSTGISRSKGEKTVGVLPLRFYTIGYLV
jgi:hypothetical protein